MQLSFYSLLYFKIPENHTLKLIKDAVDFSFINQLLEDSYCKYYGRPAKEPELMDTVKNKRQKNLKKNIRKELAKSGKTAR